MRNVMSWLLLASGLGPAASMRRALTRDPVTLPPEVRAAMPGDVLFEIGGRPRPRRGWMRPGTEPGRGPRYIRRNIARREIAEFAWMQGMTKPGDMRPGSRYTDVLRLRMAEARHERKAADTVVTLDPVPEPPAPRRVSYDDVKISSKKVATTHTVSDEPDAYPVRRRDTEELLGYVTKAGRTWGWLRPGAKTLFGTYKTRARAVEALVADVNCAGE